MVPFSVETTAHRDRTRLTAVGDVDLAAAGLLTEVGMGCLSESSTRLVVVDLGRVTFMSSAALTQLFRLRDTADNMNKGLVLSRLPEHVRARLSATGPDVVSVEVLDPGASLTGQPTVIQAA